MEFRASAGEVDVTPAPGAWLTGFGSRITPSTGIHDRLMAHAVLMDDGATQLAIVTCDLIGLNQTDATALRLRISGKIGILAQNILVCCTHTHSGPACTNFRGASMGQVDHKWLAATLDKIADLVCALPPKLEPAKVSYASTEVQGIGYNRQDASRSTDDELGVIAVTKASGGSIATIINYATHAVMLSSSNTLLSGDFPGAAARHLADLTDGIGLYIQGACGDIDPTLFHVRGWGKCTFEDIEDTGRTLAEAAVAALRDAEPTDDVILGAASKTIDLPLDPAPSLEETAALKSEFESDRMKAITSDNPSDVVIAEAMLQWVSDIMRTREKGPMPTVLSAEVFAARINDIVITGVPFEPYHDIGLAVKSGLKPRKVLFAGYCNGLFGYMHTDWAKKQGGYGPESSCRWYGEMISPFSYGSGDILTDALIDLAISSITDS